MLCSVLIEGYRAGRSQSAEAGARLQGSAIVAPRRSNGLAKTGSSVGFGSAGTVVAGPELSCGKWTGARL